VDVWVVFELDDDELRFRESGGYVRARQIHGRFPDVWRRWVGGNELSHADSPSASEEKLVAALYDESLLLRCQTIPSKTCFFSSQNKTLFVR